MSLAELLWGTKCVVKSLAEVLCCTVGHMFPAGNLPNWQCDCWVCSSMFPTPEIRKLSAVPLRAHPGPPCQDLIWDELSGGAIHHDLERWEGIEDPPPPPQADLKRRGPHVPIQTLHGIKECVWPYVFTTL